MYFSSFISRSFFLIWKVNKLNRKTLLDRKVCVKLMALYQLKLIDSSSINVNECNSKSASRCPVTPTLDVPHAARRSGEHTVGKRICYATFLFPSTILFPATFVFSINTSFPLPQALSPRVSIKRDFQRSTL